MAFKNIFKPFYRIDNSRNLDKIGTGLGLSISKSLIELMGGRIHVESEMNKGTIFRITLPLKASKRNVSPDTSEEKAIQFNGKVLVVEDNKTNQKVLGLMLNKINVEFDVAYDGEEALEVFNEDVHQMVLMDINMPKMNGDQCVSILREKGVKTKSIALTGNAMKQDIDAYKSKGFDDYVTKPLQFKVLKELF